MGDKKVEFDWVNDISSDYWDYHNVLVFNDTISYEEFDDLISYALYSKSPLNSLQWDDDGKKEAWNYLTHLVKSYSVGYLIWDKPYLAVSAQVNKSLKNPKLVNYKDIVNQKPKLDESDEFDWVEDEINEPIRFRNGDKIRVINVGDEETLIKFLGTYGKTYRTGKFGPNIEGEVVEVENNQHLFGLREKNLGQLLFFPWLDKIDYWDKNYPNLNVKYEFIDDDLNESNDLDWIRDVEPPNLSFSFDGKEHWVDVSQIDREGRKKIVNYIKKTVPNYEEFEHDLFGHISRGNYKGIIIHCGSDRTDFEPEEGLLCSGNSSYETDYEEDNPQSDILKSTYIDGQQILDYLTALDDEEELDESLEWSDKDVPFDEKDKSFESDPSWKDDEDWVLNPERSYWKQGDTGGSGGGDVNESNGLEWISNTRPILKDVFDENLIEVGDILTLYGTLEDGDGLREQQVDDFKVKIETVSNSEKPRLVSTYFKPLQKKYWGFLGYDGTGDVRFTKKDGNLQLVDRISSKDLVEESNDWDWVEDIPGTKEFDQKYRYFEIVACYNIDYESEECEDEYSHFVKIPKYEADEIWDHWVDYFAGIADGDGEEVIRYAIKNRLISHFDINEIIMFEGVRELDKNTYDKLTNYRDTEMVESNDFDWVKDVKPNWGTYYGGIIMKDIEGLPKNLEDVTSEMLSPIWMKIETINRQILTRKNRDTEHDVSETLFESMGQIEWLFERIMALVDGETDSLVSSRMEPQEYYNSRKLSIISHIKGMTKQLELLGESNDFDWVKEVGQNRTYVLDKLKKFFNKKGISVDWEHDYDENQTSHGNTEVYFGRFWFDGDDNNEYFIELYETNDGKMVFDLYQYDKTYDQYYRDEGYGNEARLNPTKKEDFWRLVAWLVLVKKGMHRSSNAKEMKESNDFDWVEDVTPRMDATLLKPGQKFYDKWGGVIRVLEYLGRNDSDGEVCYEPPCSLLRFRKVKDPSGYRMIPGLPSDDPQNTDMIMIPSDFDKHIESGKLKLVSKRTMYESKDFDWVDDVEIDKTDSKYYIIDKRSFSKVPEKKIDEWFMIEILENDKYGIHWRPYAWNLVDVHTWNPTHNVNKMSNDEFKNLLGLGSNEKPYWYPYPHDGDLTDLPKNYEYGLLSQLNTPKYLRESDNVSHFNWVKMISSDDYEPRTGDHIEIVNQGKPHLFKNWLSPTIWMDYNMGKITNSDGNIEGVVQNNYPVQNDQDNFVVKIKGTKNEYIFLPKRYKIKQIKEKTRDPEWHGLDIVYRPIELKSELKEDSSDTSDWDWAKKIEPKYTKIAPNIYQYGSGSLPRIKVVFKRVVDGEIKTTTIEFDDYEFLDSEEYMNRHFVLMGVDDEDNDWMVDGIAYLIGGGEYEWDVNWDSIENNG